MAVYIITGTGSFEDPLTEFSVTLYDGEAGHDTYTLPDDTQVFLSTALTGNGLSITIPLTTYVGDATIPWSPDRVISSCTSTPSDLAYTFESTPLEEPQLRLYTTSNTMGAGSITLQIKFQESVLGRYITLSTRTYTFYFIQSSEGEGQDYPSPAASRDEILPQAQELQDEIIMMSDPSRTIDYLIYSNKTAYNCVKSYKWVSGSEQPFEYIVMEMSKKQLSVLAPDLMDRIIAGKNIITVIGPGQGTYIVTSCKKNSSTWSITAYSAAEQIKSVKTSQSFDLLSVSNSPSHFLFEIAAEGFSRISNSSAMAEPIQAIVYLYNSERDVWETEPAGWSAEPMVIPAGLSVWYVMSLCALKLGCKIWVANNNLYIIDPTISFNDASPNIVKSKGINLLELDTIYLNKEGVFPLTISAAQESLLENIVNLPSPGKEGIEVLRNKIYVQIDPDRDYRSTRSNSTNIVADDMPGPGSEKGTIESDPVMAEATPVYPTLIKESIDWFKELSFTYHLPQLGFANAKAIANLTAELFCDSETSISFEAREMLEEAYQDDEQNISYVRQWDPLFSQLTRIHNIIDYSNDIHVSTKCNFDEGTTLNAKGLLSLVERRFPEHIATYTFGISTPTDLSQSTSMINNALNNG